MFPQSDIAWCQWMRILWILQCFISLLHFVTLCLFRGANMRRIFDRRCGGNSPHITSHHISSPRPGHEGRIAVLRGHSWWGGWEEGFGEPAAGRAVWWTEAGGWIREGCQRKDQNEEGCDPHETLKHAVLESCSVDFWEKELNFIGLCLNAFQGKGSG